MAVGCCCPSFIIHGGDHAMEPDLRALEDHKDVTRPDLLVVEPEANDRGKPCGLLHGLELQR